MLAALAPPMHIVWEDPAMWTESADLPDSFFDRMSVIAMRYGWDPVHMLKVWMSESSLKPKAWNRMGNASGLFQLMPDTAKGLGWTLGMDAFRMLTATEQVGWAERFYAQYKTYELDSPERFYLATFMPALLAIKESRSPAFIICGSAGPFRIAYYANKVFDRDNKGFVTVGDLGAAIERAAVGFRWNEIVIRMAKAMDEATEPEMNTHPPIANFTSWLDIQRELTRRGFYKGKPDNAPGPLTMNAVAMLLATAS